MIEGWKRIGGVIDKITDEQQEQQEQQIKVAGEEVRLSLSLSVFIPDTILCTY